MPCSLFPAVLGSLFPGTPIRPSLLHSRYRSPWTNLQVHDRCLRCIRYSFARYNIFDILWYHKIFVILSLCIFYILFLGMTFVTFMSLGEAHASPCLTMPQLSDGAVGIMHHSRVPKLSVLSDSGVARVKRGGGWPLYHCHTPVSLPRPANPNPDWDGFLF